MNEHITEALLQAHPDDLLTIHRYIAWVKFRRRINHSFYQHAHWLQRPVRTAHWI